MDDGLLLSTGAGCVVLADEIERLDAALRAQGAPVVAQLGGGDPAEVRALLADAGVTPHPDVVAWWAWVNPHPGPDEGWARYLTPRHRAYALDRAVEYYHRFVGSADPDLAAVAVPGWFPIVKLSYDPFVVADCDADGTAPARFWVADEGLVAAGAPLDVFVGWLADLVEQGTWVWQDGGWVEVRDVTAPGVLSEEQRASWLL